MDRMAVTTSNGGITGAPPTSEALAKEVKALEATNVTSAAMRARVIIELSPL